MAVDTKKRIVKLSHKCARCGRMEWCGVNQPKCPEGEPSPDGKKWNALDRLDPDGDKPANFKRRNKKQPPPNSIRFPKEVLDHFGYGTPGWQARINSALLEIARSK